MVDVAYSGYVTATDPVDASATMDYAFCDYRQRESRDETPEETIYHWTLIPRTSGLSPRKFSIKAGSESRIQWTGRLQSGLILRSRLA